jgi:hypothetical protein
VQAVSTEEEEEGRDEGGRANGRTDGGTRERGEGSGKPQPRRGGGGGCVCWPGDRHVLARQPSKATESISLRKRKWHRLRVCRPLWRGRCAGWGPSRGNQGTRWPHRAPSLSPTTWPPAASAVSASAHTTRIKCGRQQGQRSSTTPACRGNAPPHHTPPRPRADPYPLTLQMLAERELGGGGTFHSHQMQAPI